MRLAGGLRIIQSRPNMLFAQMDPSRYFPAILLVGLAVWLEAVIMAAGAAQLWFPTIFALVALAILVLSPLALINGSRLTIDRERGWVHWRTRCWPHQEHESFSPQRMDKIHIVKRRLRVLPVDVWDVCLALDHPRLRRVVLGTSLRYNRAMCRARQIASAVRIDWVDSKGNLHIVAPMRETMQKESPSPAWIQRTPPPPEIEVQTDSERVTLILHGTSGLHGGDGAFLIYAMLWCLWAWSSLVIEWCAFGSIRQWTGVQIWTIALIVGGSLAGGVMLIHAMLKFQGLQLLEQIPDGWVLGRRWLGYR